MCLAILVLLLARNPFSQRTLIANLDPFPDSIHYTNPALNILRGRGYVLEREGMTAQVAVPPLYPVALIPFLAPFQDVRAFYFANVFLALVSYVLMYRVVYLTFKRLSVRLVVMILYASCLSLAWYATLPMAENLILPLFLFGLNLLISKPTPAKSAMMAALCIAFYATKYASIPLSASFSLLYFIKILFTVNSFRDKHRLMVPFLISLGILGGIYELSEYLTKGKNIITEVFVLFTEVFITRPPSTSTAGPPHNVFFSTEFIVQNLRGYGGWLLGGTLVTLWRPVQILPVFLAVPATLGLILGFIKPKWRFLVLSLVVTTVATIMFMMTFYTTDGRYFYTAFPTLFLGFGLAFSLLLDFLSQKLPRKLVLLLIGLVLAIVVLPQALPLKSAIMLNLKYAETPWPYLSVLRLNDFLTTQARANPNQPRPVVISPLNPYYVDYFRTADALLLPLSDTQEARDNQAEIWGDYNYGNLTQVYTDFLQAQTPVYFASYGIGNNKFLQSAHETLKSNFVLEEVDVGCHHTCTIYRLHLKK